MSESARKKKAFRERALCLLIFRGGEFLTGEEEIQGEIFHYSEGVSVLRNVTESEQTLERLLSDSGSGNFRLDTLSVAVENAVSQILVNEENISTGQIIYNRKLNTFLKDRNE